MSTPRVLNVGQCGYDSGSISRFLRDTFQAQTLSVSTAEEALSTLRKDSFQIVLINRILDSDGSPGLELLRAIKMDPVLTNLPTMLISNYADAQADAVRLGACPGFGKADLGRAKAVAALKPLLSLIEIS